MSKSRDKLIIPKKSASTSQGEKSSTDFIKEVYVNALKYYAEDDTADKENILTSSIFLYSFGDENIYKSKKTDDTLATRDENRIKESVKESVKSFANSMIAVTQFRYKDRKFILDLNIYNSGLYKSLISLDFPSDESLTNKILNSLKGRIISKEDDIDKKLLSINEAVQDVTVKKSFNGIIDNVDFQEKLQEKPSAENSDKYSGEYIENGYIDYDLDDYFKASLQEWKKKHDSSSKLKDFKVDVFPHIEIKLLDNSKYLSMLVVTPYDQNFVDNKTLEIDKVFDCSFFVFEAPQEVVSNFKVFKRDVKAYLSSYIHECANHKLQTSMDGSIGEASDIARHWYSTGIGNLFQKDVISTFDNDSNANNFYVKFIDELLCKIDNINNTEIYPFDRVFIFPNTGVDDLKNSDNSTQEIKEIIVIEAHVKSTDPLDQGGYIASWEGLATDDMSKGQYSSLMEDIAFEEEDEILAQEFDESQVVNFSADTSSRLIEDIDLNFSDKRVSKLKWKLDNDSNSIKIHDINDISDDPACIDSNLLIGTLLLSRELQSKVLNGDKDAANNKLARYLRKNRTNFDEMGIYYEYSHGISLPKEFPHLYDLQNKYFQKISDEIMSNDNEDLRDNLSIPNAELRTKDINPLFRKKIRNDSLIKKLRFEIKNNFKSKVVVVSFDPSSIQNKEEASFVDSEANAFTMVFVADVDFTKSVGELNSEIKDFKVLIQMVIRQIINHKANEQKIEDEQVRVRGVLDSSIHNIKSFLSSQVEKKKVDFVLQDALSKLVSNKKNEVRKFNSYDELFRGILKPESDSLEAQVKTYGIDSSTFEVQSNVTLFPALNIEWDDTFIPEAFNVMLKNSVEYASVYGVQNGTKGQVIVYMQLDSLTNNEEYLIVTIINNTQEISKSRFDKMNDESLKNMGIDEDKEGSTGIGVVQARRQIQGINSKNNIIFKMIDKNTISAKMKIKIERVEDIKLFSDEIDSECTKKSEKSEEFSGVLYFEDTPMHYEKSISFMQSAGIDFLHSVRRVSTPMKNAVILLTDMSILNTKDEADAKEGLEAIESFLEVNEINAPICVLSNGNATSIKSNICTKDTGIAKDKVIIISSDSYDTSLEKGFIYIIDNVKELGTEHKMILEYLKIHAPKVKEVEEEISQNNFEYSSSIMLNKSQEYSEEFITLFKNLDKNIEDQYFYITKHSVEDGDIQTVLSKWNDFKTKVSGEGDRERFIANTTYHQNTLLIINNYSLENTKECLWLFYLGITNNIYFNFNNLSIEDIMQRWGDIAIKRESSGYLSKLRHDVKNIKSQYEAMDLDQNLEKYFQTIIDTSDTLQSQLKMSIYESLDTYIDSLELKDESKFNYEIVSDVEKNMDKMVDTLDSILDILSQYSHDKEVKNIALFRKILNMNSSMCKMEEV